MRKILKEIKNRHVEQHSDAGALFKEFILGGQDGLVNVLGVILGIAAATAEVKLVIIAGLAAAFAESFSMAAVAYTSAKAEKDYYESQKQKELNEIKTVPEIEKKEIYDIYFEKGFRGKLLNNITNKIVSNKKMWLDIMMKDELNISDQFIHPAKSAVIVGLAAIIGSIIPLMAFFLFPINGAIVISTVISAIALFVTGAIEGKITVGSWVKKGIQLAVIGMMAAGIGFAIGGLLGVSV